MVILLQALPRLNRATGGYFLERDLLLDSTMRGRRGRVDRSGPVVAAEGRPMPVAHRMHLRPWTDGKRKYPEQEVDAITPVGFPGGLRAVIAAEAKQYATLEVSISGFTALPTRWIVSTCRKLYQKLLRLLLLGFCQRSISCFDLRFSFRMYEAWVFSHFNVIRLGSYSRLIAAPLKSHFNVRIFFRAFADRVQERKVSCVEEWLWGLITSGGYGVTTFCYRVNTASDRQNSESCDI
jgi:hypothetical protein